MKVHKSHLFIGGPKDGEKMAFPDHQHDVIVVERPVNRACGYIPQGTPTKPLGDLIEHRYVRERIAVEDEAVAFWRQSNLTPLEAILRLVENYTAPKIDEPKPAAPTLVNAIEELRGELTQLELTGEMRAGYQLAVLKLIQFTQARRT